MALNAPIRLLMIADDPTGALDSSVPFAERGMTVQFRLTDDMPDWAGVITLSLNSREVAAKVAASRAAQAARLARRSDYVFKKIDSRLKGHVSAEVQAVAQITGRSKVLFSPAIPAMGRIVRDGCLSGAGVDRPMSLRPFVDALQGLQVVVPETTCDADLDAAVASAGPDTLFVGARGLASALARRLCDDQILPKPALSGDMIFVVGSRDPVTLQQVVHLRKACPDLPFFAATNGVVETLPTRGSFILQAVPGSLQTDGATVAKRLAESIYPFVGRDVTMVVTGGETAAAVMQRAACTELLLLGEVLPGVPVCRMADGSGFRLITKSGGFGSEDTLSSLALHCRPLAGVP